MKDYQDELLKTIQDALDNLEGSIPDIEKDIYARLLMLLKELKTNGANLANDAASQVYNLKKIQSIKKELDKIILNPNYKESIANFATTYAEIAAIQNTYFTTLVDTFSPSKVLDEIANLNIQATVDSLTEAGIGSGVKDGIKEILRTNITSGGSYSDLTEQLRTYIISDKDSDGELLKYVRQTATDAINQYSASYTETISKDLNLDWFAYSGSLIKTSRPFCIACVDKYYIHRSEFPSIVNGNIDGKKVSLAGQIPGTNENNFPIYRGGYSCQHMLIPISEDSIPDDIKEKIK